MAGSDSTFLKFDVGEYLRSHWCGAQSLAWSFWVNLALLSAVLLTVENIIIDVVFDSPSVWAIAAFVSFVAFRIAILVWQIIGLVRACDRYQLAYGSIAAVWAVHFAILVSLALVCTSVIASAQSVFLEPNEELLSARWERERAARYDLTLSGDGTVLFLNGSFEGGITKRIAALAEEHRELRTIVLASPGGNTFEGRGVAQIIRTLGLDTHVAGDCFSACTIAFIAGQSRTIGTNGRLGFHRYGLEAQYRLPFFDIGKEQDTDRESFKSQNVSTSFLEKIFDAPRERLWIPDTGELAEAGVIHAVAVSPTPAGK